MGLIAASDQQVLREQLAALSRPVRLLFFAGGGEDEDDAGMAETRQILGELPALSDRIAIEEVALESVAGAERASGYGVDRAPTIVVEAGANLGAADGYQDTRMQFLGAPGGYEFISLVQAIRLAGGVPFGLSDDTRRRLAALTAPLTIRVFTTPTCSQCPRAVTLAHALAFESPHIRAVAVEATAFPDLARRYRVNGVPKTVVLRGSEGDGSASVEILGAVPEDAFVEQVLAAAGGDAAV